MFKANLLKAKIIACEKTAKDVASMLGINESTFYRKIRGKSDFTRDEIQKIREYLKMTVEEVEDIFFAS